MKKQYFLPVIYLFLCLCFICLSNLAFGQVYKKVRKVVSIHSEQSFYLNGGNRAMLGGKSRTSLLIRIPANTVEWYYVFSTTPHEGGTANFNLVAQLSKLIDPSGVMSIATSSLFAPTGLGGGCDIYLFDRENRDKFENKEDLLGNGFYSYPEGKRVNYAQGVVNIKGITSGHYYLGFKNPSATTGTNVVVEIAAIVEETVLDNSTWSADAKKNLYENVYKAMPSTLNESAMKEMVNCFVEKFISQKTPEEIGNMSESAQNNFQNEIYNSCFEKYKVQKTPEQEKGKTFGALGWKTYLNGELDKAIEYSKRALTHDNTLGFVKANLGLFMLIKGDEMTAMEYYVDAISDIKADKVVGKAQLKEVIEDIESAKKKYPDFKGYQNIKGLLEHELSILR